MHLYLLPRPRAGGPDRRLDAVVQGRVSQAPGWCPVTRRDLSAMLVASALALGILLGAPSRASADRETAEFMAKRGERMLKENDAAGAAEQYRRSIGEDAEFLPAHTSLVGPTVGRSLPTP